MPGATVRMPRGRRGTAAVLVAVVGLVASAFAAVLAFHAAAQHRPWLVDARSVSRFGRDTTLGDTVVLVVGVVVAVVGLLLLLAALVPPRRRLVELADHGSGIAAGLTRRSLARTLAAAAQGVDGVSGASVGGRRRLTVSATTSLRQTDGLADRVRDVVTARLTELDPARPRPVRVRLRRKDR